MKGMLLALVFILCATFAHAATVDTTISQSSDDAYFRPNGWPGYSHTDSIIYTGKLGSETMYGGFRFTNLNIPENSIIVNAYVNFTQDGWGYVIPTLLSFENAASPNTFSSANTPYDRWSNKTNFELDWTWPKNTPGSIIQTPNLSGGIQELVDAYGEIDEVTLLERGNDSIASGQYHNWVSYDASPSSAATIYIEYESGQDITPPLLSDAQPSGELLAGTVFANLSAISNEPASCRYGNTPNVSFSSQPTPMSVDGSKHFDGIEVEDNTSYTYYVRCNDTAGNVNPSDFIISFSVAAPDVTAPSRSNGQPTGNLSEGSTNATLSLETDEVAECRYANATDTAYSSMAPFSTTNTVQHQQSINGLQDGQTYLYYIKCSDTAGNTNTNDYPINFSIDTDSTPPVIIDPDPSGILATSTTAVNLSVTTNEQSHCHYDTSAGIDFNSMSGHMHESNGFTHKDEITSLSPGSYTFYVRCADERGNANQNDTLLEFSIAQPGPILENGTVAQSSDDAYMKDNGWPGYSHTNSIVYAGSLGSDPVYGGWRFTNLNIPANAEISSAHVTFTQDGWGYQIPTNLSFEDTASPATFSSSSTPMDRWTSRTSFNIQWVWNKSVPDSLIQSPSLTEGVQELVDTHGALNEIVLLEVGALSNGESHSWTSYDSSPNSAAYITIEYQLSGGDAAAPVISNGQPSGTLPFLTNVTLGVETNENATCKFNATAGLDYEVMLPQFATTGGTSHASVIETTSGTYTYYVRCSDAAGNVNTEDYTISFTIDEPDTTPPITNLTCTPASCSSSSLVSVTLSCTDQGSCTPEWCTGAGCSNFQAYTGPISLSSSTVLSYRSKDQAGNTETTQSQTITVSGSMPRVLFIGNSLTDYNGHQATHIAGMAAYDGLTFEWDKVHAGGTTLTGHWDNGIAQGVIQNGSYDIVVLQPWYWGDSNTNVSTYQEAVRNFHEIIEPTGAETWLFQAYPDGNCADPTAFCYHGPDLYEEIINVTDELAAEIGGRVVPVLEAWGYNYEFGSDLHLYSFYDSTHPSLRGTYLNSALFYYALSGNSPIGNNYSINASYGQVDSPPSDDTALNSTEEAALQQIAHNIWQAETSQLPRITVISPQQNASLPSGAIEVDFEVANHVLGDVGETHLIYFIDGETEPNHFYNGLTDEVWQNGEHTHFTHWLNESAIQLFGLAPGQHGVRFALVNSTGAELTNSQAEAVLNFTILSPPAGEFSLVEEISGLNFPVAMAEAPDGRIFYNELGTGNIRVIEPGFNLVSEPFINIPTYVGGERGLLGLALDPNYTGNGYVYAYHTKPNGTENEIVRIQTNASDPNKGHNITTIFDNINASENHNGGNIHFGPDGKLYVSVGDAETTDTAQNPSTVNGGILRINADGSIPLDNPFGGSATYAYGLRNSFDFTFHPHTGDLWATENGPTEDDEVNKINAGENYGWPIVTGIVNNPNYTDPILNWTPPIAPTGIIAVSENAAIGENYHDNLLVADFISGKLQRIVLAGNNLDELVFVTDAYTGGNGGLIDILETSNGEIYVSSTSGSIFRVNLTG